MEGPPVVVTTSIHINHFHASSDTNMDYTVTMFFRTRWKDERLMFTDDKNHSVTLGADGVGEVWLPPLFFPDEKTGHFHTITTDNTLLRIYTDGTILHSTRVTLTLGCNMQLERYPMDVQKCRVELESFTYETDDLILQWAPEDDDMAALELEDGMKSSQFEVFDSKAVRKPCVKVYSTGNFSCLQANFNLARVKELFIMSSYLPSVLIVVLSWFSFWINPNSEPARVALCMTAILTLCTQINGIQATLPKVQHLKAIDVWMSACLIFVFAALVEFAAVNYKSLCKKTATSKSQSDESNCLLEMKEFEDRDDPKSNNVESETKTDVVIETQSKWKNPRKSIMGINTHVQRYFEQSKPEDIDYFSRFLFPVAFLIFNLFYWPTYLQWLS
ncbi:glycine receptor subunit alpha-2-like [Glandiceps talaboti]